MDKRIMVAISGASGMSYARRLVQVLPENYDRVYLTASENAMSIMNDEIGVKSLSYLIPSDYQTRFRILDSTDLFTPPASGSHGYDGLIIIPCSMGVLGRIASGISNDLITRAADVCLKERRKLILVVRETPYSLIHLKNMTVLTEAGATILPASPAFYSGANSVDDLVDFVVDRVLQSVGVQTRLIKGWRE